MARYTLYHVYITYLEQQMSHYIMQMDKVGERPP